jgi:hypothetical protein
MDIQEILAILALQVNQVILGKQAHQAQLDILVLQAILVSQE